MTSDVQIRQATASDLDAVLALLRAHGLLLDGLEDHLATTLVAASEDGIVGSAALEMYPDGALLRSVAVAPSVQGRGLGRQLTTTALQRAAELGAPAVYLLTTTAAGYFATLGFVAIDRPTVPDGVRSSVEFAAACCASARVMKSA